MVKFVLGMIIGVNISLMIMRLLFAAIFDDCEK